MKQPPKPHRQFCIILAEDTLKRISEEIAKRDGVTKSHWIREAIQAHFKGEKK